jgi:hypothetical protein
VFGGAEGGFWFGSLMVSVLGERGGGVSWFRQRERALEV